MPIDAAGATLTCSPLMIFGTGSTTGLASQLRISAIAMPGRLNDEPLALVNVLQAAAAAQPAEGGAVFARRGFSFASH